MKYFVAFVTVIFFASKTSAQSDIVKFVNPASLSSPKGYSHAAVIDLGRSRMMIMSGQVPLNNKAELVGEGNFSLQTEQVFTNIKSLVESEGGNFSDIVKITIFVTDASKIDSFRMVRNRFIDAKNPPASSFVEVSRLFRADVLVEVEATAIIPKKR